MTALAEPADERTPFERVEDLTRRLVAVPKDEVDAEAVKDPRGKAKK